MSYSYNTNLLNMYQGQQYPISYGTTQVDPSQVAGYALAASNNANDDSKITDGVGMMSVFCAGSGAYKISKYAKNTGTTVTDVLKTTASTAKKDISTLTNIVKTQDKAALTKYVNLNKANQEIFNLQASLPSAKKLGKMTEETKAVYEQASKALTRASKAKTIATKEKYISQSKALIEKATGKASKAAKATAKTAETVATATKAASTATKAASTATKATSIGSKLVKGIKGNAAFIAIEGGIELFTNVVPTFKQLGAEKGMKQLGKSTVKVAASVGGWAAGAAIGAAIGSVIPGAGTAIGAVVGGAISFISGLICSSAASKLATKIVGKDELELAAEKEQQEEQQQTATVSNEQLMQQVGISDPTTTQQTSTVSNPFLTASYTTQDNSDNLLMMPLRSGFQLTA